MALKSFTDTITDPHHVMKYGEFQGRTIREIIRARPDYLIWMQRENPDFDLDHKLLDEAEEALETWRP